MRTTLIVKRLVQAAVLGTALVAASAMAQPGPGAGWGGGWCGGPGMQRGMAGPGGGWGMGPGGGRGMGYGRGYGYGMGPGAYANQGAAAGQNAVRGLDLMSPVERSEQQAKMRDAKTYDECTAIQTEHRGMLELRAKEKGLTLAPLPFNPCDNLKARGFIK